MRIVVLGLLLTLAVGCTSRTTPASLADFTSDRCSGGYPEGTSQQPKLWCDCCVTHDLAYWKGGTADERRAADRELERCVAAKGEPRRAWRMRLGVWLGGGPYWPTGYRWAYGWPYGRGYAPLTDEERAAVAVKAAAFDGVLKAECAP